MEGTDGLDCIINITSNLKMIQKETNQTYHKKNTDMRLTPPYETKEMMTWSHQRAHNIIYFFQQLLLSISHWDGACNIGSAVSARDKPFRVLI